MTPTLQEILQATQLLVLIAGGVFIFFKVGRTTGNMEQILVAQAKEITDLKTNMDKFGNALTAIAVQDNRLDRVESDIHELRHGRGFVNPM